jgi:glyceraldehyde 3-phosphate dehydrogenase
MSINIGINVLGRIGRMVIRSLVENKNKNIEIRHINNRTNSETSSLLLKYDSVHGKFNSNINYNKNNLIISKKKISFSQETELSKINWKKYGVDIVLECTGKYNSKEKCIQHIKNGAKKVIVSAPCKNADKTIVYGVNHKTINKNDLIISAASCTTNCFAPVAFVINKEFKIEKGFMTTIHSYTSDQRLLDNSHKDPRRARSAGQSIVPTSTGASKALGEIIPELKGKLDGLALRVPTPNVSLVDFVFNSKNKLSVKKINDSFIKASNKELKNVLDTTNERLVSVDFNHNPNSAIIDLSLTSVVGDNMGKVSAWYDNEWGFASRMNDLVEYIHKV